MVLVIHISTSRKQRNIAEPCARARLQGLSETIKILRQNVRMIGFVTVGKEVNEVGFTLLVTNQVIGTVGSFKSFTIFFSFFVWFYW